MNYVPMDDKYVLPKPYEPDWKKLKSATSESQFSEASFYLLREAAQLVAAIAGLKPRVPIKERNDAILLGLIVKAAKVTKGILRDASDGEVEQQLSMFREFIEAIANLLWLMHDDGSGSRFSMFVEAGLGAEKSMLATIAKNVDERGGEALHIEKRMIASITDTLKAADIEDVSEIRSGKELAKQGFPKIEQRVQELGEIAYFAYRGPSASVHTTWSDIFKHHLEYNGTEFSPNMNPPRRQPQALTTISAVISSILPEYINRMFDEDTKKRILPLLESLGERTKKLTEAHEEYLAKKGEPKTSL